MNETYEEKELQDGDILSVGCHKFRAKLMDVGDDGNIAGVCNGCAADPDAALCCELPDCTKPGDPDHFFIYEQVPGE